MNQFATNKKNSLLLKVIFTLVLFIGIASITPQFRVISIYQLSLFVTVVLLIFVMILMRPSFFLKPNVNMLITVFFVIYTFIVPYLSNNAAIGNRYLDTGIMFILYLVYKFIKVYGYNNINRNIIIGIIPISIFTSINTLKALINSPYISRSIKTQGEVTTQLRGQGIGGYEFIYFLVFVSIIIFYVLLHHKEVNLNKKQRISLTAILTLFLITVLYSNYFTALLMIIASFSIMVIMEIKNIIRKLLILPVILLTALFSKTIFFNSTDLIIRVLDNGATVEKLLALQKSILNYNMQTSVFIPRFSTIESSFEAFRSNPLTGIIFESTHINQVATMGFGQHSYFMDTFALFGIFIGIINLILVLQPFIERMRLKRLSALNFSFLISVLILFFMNNVTLSIGYAVFFIYPLIYDALLDYTNKKTIMR